MSYPPYTPQQYGSNYEILSAIPAEQMFSVAIEYIKRQQIRDRLRARLTEIQQDYANLERHHDKDMANRDRDRQATQAMMQALIDAGHPEMATVVFSRFMDERPKFGEAVISLILRRLEHGGSI
jgi:hypothetical protein